MFKNKFLSFYFPLFKWQSELAAKSGRELGCALEIFYIYGYNNIMNGLSKKYLSKREIKNV